MLALVLLALAPAAAPVVEYAIAVELDPAEKKLDGRATVKFTNTSTATIDALWWHLYLNAFRNDRSTLMRDSGGGKLRKQAFERPNWGTIDLLGMTLEDGTDLYKARTFEQPDDGNSDDHTVMKTPIPPLAPGASITVKYEFLAKLPRVFARTGWGGDFIMVAQWFPKLGVLERSGRWNVHQFHPTTEFFADFGDYRVEITVPKGFEVGATGKRVGTAEKNGKQVLTYEQDRVHDFAFAVDPRFVRVEREFDPARDVSAADIADATKLLGRAPEALPKIQVTALLQPEHVEFTERYYRALFAAIRWFGLWYGPYPYETLTLVDGPRVASGAMGMEYPTLITAGVRWPAPEDIPAPESVTIHELGHQYWYGLVATNEFEEAWLDEGFNTYSTGKVMDRAYGPMVYAPGVLGFPTTAWLSGIRLDATTTHKLVALSRPASDAIERAGWMHRNTTAYTINTYHKPALMLRALEQELGEDGVARLLRSWREEFQYRHPTARDFTALAEKHAGRSLEAFFDRTLRATGELDYGVGELSSKRVKSPAGSFGMGEFVSEEQARAMDELAPPEYQTEVVVERDGEIIAPLEVEVTFEDGKRERRAWDGVYRWARFKFIGPAKATSAKIYPDTPPVLDVDNLDDSRVMSFDARPSVAWGATFLYVAQTLLHVAGGWW